MKLNNKRYMVPVLNNVANFALVKLSFRLTSSPIKFLKKLHKCIGSA